MVITYFPEVEDAILNMYGEFVGYTNNYTLIPSFFRRMVEIGANKLKISGIP